MGLGALTGAASALASGSSLKGALKARRAARSTRSNPGALKALGRLKGLKSAQKILQGKQLSKMERLAIEGSHLKGPLWRPREADGEALHAARRLWAGEGVLQGSAGRHPGLGQGRQGAGLPRQGAGDGRPPRRRALAHPPARAPGGGGGRGQCARPSHRRGGRLRRTRRRPAEAGAGDGTRRIRPAAALPRPFGQGTRLRRREGSQKAYGRRTARDAAREGKREGIEAVAKDKLARHGSATPSFTKRCARRATSISRRHGGPRGGTSPAARWRRRSRAARS